MAIDTVMSSGTLQKASEFIQQHPLLTATLSLCTTAFLYNMSRILGFSKIKYHHATNSIELKTKSAGKMTFAELCRSVIPPCRLNPFLFNGHLQTMYTVIKAQDLPVYYKRWTFENEDPSYTGSFAVDFAVKPNQELDPMLPPRTTHYTQKEFDGLSSTDSRPMLVALHGLSGGSHELYLRHVLAPLITEEAGWEACVVISRGCSNTKITSSVLFNARSTWDLRQTVKWLRKTFPNRPLYGVGFSLGANIITNYTGEEGSDCAFKGVVALSSPWDLNAGNLALQRTWLGREVYSRAMGASLKKLFDVHAEELVKNPSINVEQVHKVKYLHEFDRAIQVPCWGYPTETAYYRDAASNDSLLAIRVPFLAVNAIDDPVTSSEGLPYQEVLQTPYGVLCTTSLGGHLSWFELGGGRWFAKATTAFFQRMARDVDIDSYSKNHPLPEEKIIRHQRAPLKPWFAPMRRRMHLEVA